METTDSKTDAVLIQAVGKRIKSATSSLSSFSIELEDGSALLANADRADGEPAIRVTSVAASSLPELADAVCSVDWSWICGSTLKKATLHSQQLKLELDPAGPLTISLAVWQGSPFLSFQPFRPPKH